MYSRSRKTRRNGGGSLCSLNSFRRQRRRYRYEERIKITVFDEREGLPFLLSRIIISASDLSFPFLRLATKLIRLARESPSNVALFEASLKRGANSAKTFRHNGGRETTVTLLREIRIESSFSSWKIFISSKI